MGAWGTGNFDNDSAMDWVGEFLESPRFARVARTARRFIDGETEAEAALAAAEVMSALRGHPAEDLPDELAEWLGISRVKVIEDETRHVTEAVKSVLKESELRSLWLASAEFEGWERTQRELLSRLRRKPQPRSTKTSPKAPVLRLWPRHGKPIKSPFRADKPPALSQQPAPIVAVEIDVGEHFSLPDYRHLTDWLRRSPEIEIMLSDSGYGNLDAIERAWHSMAASLPLFSAAHRLRLSLPRLQDLSFLTEFDGLRGLALSNMPVDDIGILAGLASLDELQIGFAPNELLLSQLQGLHARHLDFRYSVIADAETEIDVLASSETLMLDFYHEQSGFEIPSLKNFSNLKRIHFRAVSKKSLQNVLAAPLLEELFLFIDKSTLNSCVTRLKDAATLKKLTILSAASELDGFDADHEVMESLGLEQPVLDTWFTSSAD